jgi:uncharacterized protein (TIGR02391 family)
MASEKGRIVHVTWDANLQISKGDEIEITRGIGDSNTGDIRASVMKNVTTGREERSRIEGVLMTTMPEDINPPIKGIVREIRASSSATVFELVEGIGVLEVNLLKLIREIEPYLDKELVEKCIHKEDVEDVVTSGFRVVEERIRAKIGASASSHGVDLIDEALNPSKGKLVFGKTQPEQLGTYLLFRGSFLLFRNPPSHRYIGEYTEFEVLEIATLVNLLLGILDKCQLRTP